jgi:hypothetical protein
MNTTFKEGFDKTTSAEDLNWVLKPWEQVSDNEIQHPAYKYGILLDKALPEATFEVTHYNVLFSEDNDELLEVIKVSTKYPLSEADKQTLRDQLIPLGDFIDANTLTTMKVVHHLEELDDESYIELVILAYIEF